MQGRLELQITVPTDRPQGQPSLVQLTLNQTVTTAPMQPSTLQPNGAVQGTVAWSPLLGPVTTTSATWQQPAPQQHFSWQQPPNLIPSWLASWNPNTGAYNIQHQPAPPPVHNPVPWMTTGLVQSGWQSTPPYQQQQVFPPATLQPQAATQPSTSVQNQQQVN